MRALALAMRIELPWPHRDLQPNSRGHWRKRAAAAKKAKAYAHWATLEQRRPEPLPTGKLLLMIDFVPPDRRRRDDDNLIASFKSYRDGIAQALGIDDARFVTHATVSDETIPDGRVMVTIAPVAASLGELLESLK